MVICTNPWSLDHAGWLAIVSCLAAKKKVHVLNLVSFFWYNHPYFFHLRDMVDVHETIVPNNVCNL